MQGVLIRRLVTNEINTGLSLEAFPDEAILGMTEEEANDWAENVESRFFLWGNNPNLCDFKRVSTFGEIQRQARMEALISGDVLVVLRFNNVTNLPAIQLISGEDVQTPLLGKVSPRKGNTIEYGVELNSNRRPVAYWVRQKDGSSKRLSAVGERSGRRQAWLLYGTEKRHEEVRGLPLFTIIMQSLKEIDRYRDAAARKAVLNAILAMFIKKDQDKLGTRPVSGGATRIDQGTVTNSNGDTRQYNLAGQIPGLVFEELQVGETPVGFNNQGVDVNFGVFEEAMVQSIAWANEIPPEILTLAFSNNYSASQAAINEFKIYLNKRWYIWGETLCAPLYQEWLISEVQLGMISAPGMLQSWRDPLRYDEYGAWVTSEWYGNVKPSTGHA